MEGSRWAGPKQGGSGQGMRMERCLLGKEEVALPESFVDQTNIFRHVMSQDTWDNVLSDEQRDQLKKLLPSFPEEVDQAEKDETARRLFAGENFKFGNPLLQFHQKMKDGNLSPDIARYASLCRKFKYREYKFSQQNHFSHLLQEILISRQRTLGQLNGLPPDKPLKFHHSPPKERHKGIKHRVRKNYTRILKEAREECGLEDTSSEEEESVSTNQRSRRQLFKSLGPIPSPEPTTPSVVATYASRPSTLNGDISGNHTSKRPRPISPVEISEEDYKQMLKNHKRKKLDTPDLSELETQSITLQDILSRCQAGKKANKPPTPANGEAGPEASPGAAPMAKKKPRVREKGERKLKRKIKQEKGAEAGEEREMGLSLQAASANLDVHSDLLVHRDDDGVPDFPLPDTLPSRLTMGQADNFLSLLRDIICDFPDSKATTAKLEERVREWQESPASALNAWLPMQQNWVECVVSALKFLSGDVLGLSVENFVPFLDYKERAQQWKWIGAGRDSNQQLAVLFRHWLKHKNAEPVDGLGVSQGSPPPVRTKTNFVVRPTTAAEKAMYRDQERLRFENPHRAFTYQLHGYESVVGPVKGVYNKDNAMTKAREHALLISDRPAFVTILTLVRDAAARLPNGEGTRGDICELLKDSQFLAPAVTDTQINTVVSGALDRLHSEKDPCVKYDVNSKLWIYLHRSRTEEEFERIHQAQGAAAKAKKSLQRPKASKAIKDQVSTQSAVTPTVKAALAQTAAGSVSSSGELKLDDITALVPTALSASKALTDSPSAPTPTTQTASPSPTTTAATPTPAGRKPVSQLLRAQQADRAAASSAKSRAGATVSQTISASLLGGRAQSVGILSGQAALQQNSSLLASLGKSPSAPGSTVNITKAPVVTVTKQGLTMGARPSASSHSQGEITIGGSSGATARHSPVILTQESGSRSSTPTSVTVTSVTPQTGAKLLSLGQATGAVSSGAVVTGAGDNPMVARLVQQMTGAQQVVSVSNIPARSVSQSGGQQRGTTLKIQGGSIVQPVQLAGKPLTTANRLLQLGGKGGQPLGVIQTSHGQISTLSLIPQALTSTSSTTATTVAATAASGGSSKLTVAGATASSTSAGSPVTLTMVGSPATSGSPQSKTQVITHVATTGAASSPVQAKVVSPSQAGMVVTQLAPGGILRPGLTAASQAKMVAAGQAGLVPAQFIVQQAPGVSTSQAGAQ
ncbi:hypothetical protein BaRGS_00026155, partial [Batillaria attramentaria]